MANLHRIRQEVRPRVAEELRLMDKRISAVLDKDQQRMWDRQFRRLQEQLQLQMPPYRGRPQDPRGPMAPQAGPGDAPLSPPEGRPLQTPPSPGQPGNS